VSRAASPERALKLTCVADANEAVAAAASPDFVTWSFQRNMGKPRRKEIVSSAPVVMGREDARIVAQWLGKLLHGVKMSGDLTIGDFIIDPDVPADERDPYAAITLKDSGIERFEMIYCSRAQCWQLLGWLGEWLEGKS
jgi:hypothetical protein